MSRVVGLALAGVLVMAGAPVTPVAVAGPADGTLTVRLVRDVNGNGSYEPALEIGVAGVPVTVTDPAGNSAKGTTGADGVVKIDLGPVTGGSYRVEAAIPPALRHLEAAPAGNGLSGLTEFVTGPNPTLTMGVWNPADYCQANPTLTTACQRNTQKAGTDPAARSLVMFPFTARGTAASTQRAKQGETGTVFGIAYRKQDKRLFSGAFAKRLAPYGPGGPGAIYVTTQAGTTSLFATVPSAGNTQHSDNADGAFFAVPGKEALGDLEMSEDGTALYAVNLANKTLYVYDATINTATAPVATHAIPNPGCPNATDWRPSGLGSKDGVLYVGGVCSGQSTNTLADLRAVVLPFQDNAFGAVVVTKQLDFERGTAIKGTDNRWHPWLDTWDLKKINAVGKETVAYTQPMLTNIAVENDGDMVLAFRDRFGDQVGQQTPSPEGRGVYNAIIGGDLNRACKAATGYVWEGTPECPNNRTDKADGAGQPNTVMEYYPGEYFPSHAETSMGGVTLVPGADRMPATVMNPLAERTAGVGWFDRGLGTMQNDKHTNGLQLMNDTQEGWGMANGLADLEALCDLAPVQLGNRVWFDADTDGVQDGNEPPLPGVKVTPTPCAGGTALPPKTTNAKGEYAFSTADGLKPNTCYNLKFDFSGAQTTGIPGTPPGSSLKWTAREAGPNRGIDSNVDPGTGLASVTIGGAGSAENSIDAGVVAPTSTIGDHVWADMNRNGQQDPNEPPVPGLTVTLGSRKTTTGPDGKYVFDKLPDGAYQVCFDFKNLPGAFAGYLPAIANSGSDGTDSDADPTTGCAPQVTMGPAKREDLTLDAGIRPPNSVGDLVWSDANRNGVQDSGEPPVPGVTVTVQGVGNAVTGLDGKYLFDKLPDGKYTVCFDLKNLPSAFLDFEATKPNAGEDGKDSDIDPATGCAPPTTLSVTAPENLNVDVGLIPPVNRLGDFVWQDLNRNGLQDAGEPGLPNVEVAVGDARTTTGRDGKYLFEGLPDGKYKVCFGRFGDLQTTTPNTGDDNKNSDADPVSGCSPEVTLGPGNRSVLSVDAGFVSPPNKLGDFVWHDQNRNGIQDAGEPGLAGVPVTAGNHKATTGQDGKYLFDALPDGKYTVCFGRSGDFQFTKPNGGDDGKDSDGDAATGCAPEVTLGPGSREILTLDAGLAAPVNRLGDSVWNDANRNGRLDAGEPGVPGVVVSSGALQATTDANGKYLLEGLPDGTHKVCFDAKTLPEGYVMKAACSAEVTLGPGRREDLTLDVGLLSPPNKLGDFVWNDVDRNGLQDSGEPGLAGVTVTVGDLKTTTGADGKYLFDNLGDGKYVVCFKASSQVTKPQAGDAAKDSDPDPATACSPEITLGPGNRENLNVDAGLIAPVNRLGDSVFLDANRNGQQDPGELGVPGVTVTVGGMTAVTDANGKYLIEGLPDGKYKVCFQPAKDYQLTFADGCTPEVTLGPDDREILTLDVGLVAPPNKIGDLVWVDHNRDGVHDPAEQGVAGVTVTANDLKTTTGPDGKYLFEGMPDGDYRVCFELKAGQYASYLPTSLGKDSEAQADGCAGTVTVGPGQREKLDIDAGIRPPNALGDLVWVDTNRNTLQDQGEPGVPGVTVSAGNVKTKTGPDGRYLIENLGDGQHVVCFDRTTLPAQYAEYQLTKGAVDPATWCTLPTRLYVQKPEDLTMDAGLVEPRNRIGDLVWVDHDGDGVHDSGEPGAPNVPVLLRTRDGQELANLRTDKNGKYLFDELADGSFVVCVVKTDLKGYSIGSGVDTKTGCAKPVTVGPPGSRELLTVDIGLLTPKALAKTGSALGWLVGGGVVILVIGLLLLVRRV